MRNEVELIGLVVHVPKGCDDDRAASGVALVSAYLVGDKGLSHINRSVSRASRTYDRAPLVTRTLAMKRTMISQSA